MTYNYKCTNSNCPKREFSIEKGINDPAPKECLACGSKVNQVFKPVGIIWNCQGAYGGSNTK